MALFEDASKLRVTIMLTREQRDELQELADRAELSRSQVARAALVEGMTAVRRTIDARDLEDIEAGVMYDQRTGQLTPDGNKRIEAWLGEKGVAPCCTEAPECGVFIYEYTVVTGVLDASYVKSYKPSPGRALVHVGCNHCATVRLYDAGDIFGQSVGLSLG